MCANQPMLTPMLMQGRSNAGSTSTAHMLTMHSFHMRPSEAGSALGPFLGTVVWVSRQSLHQLGPQLPAGLVNPPGQTAAGPLGPFPHACSHHLNHAYTDEHIRQGARACMVDLAPRVGRCALLRLCSTPHTPHTASLAGAPATSVQHTHLPHAHRSHRRMSISPRRC